MTRLVRPATKLLVLWMLLLSGYAQAAFRGATSADGIEYFLFATPDKIERFDTATGEFLAPLTLTGSPTAAAVRGNTAFVVQGKTLVAYPLDGGSSSTVLTAAGTATFSGVAVVGEHLVVPASSGLVTALSATTYQWIDDQSFTSYYTGGPWRTAKGSRHVFHNTQGISPGDVMRLAIDANGMVQANTDSPYHGDFSTGGELFPVAAGNRVVSEAGVVYDIDLKYVAALGGRITGLAEEGNDIVVVRDGQLLRLDAQLRQVSSRSVNNTPSHIALHNGVVFHFATTDSTVTARRAAFSTFVTPAWQPAPEPETLSLTPTMIVADTAGRRLFMLASGQPAVFAWSLAEERWLPGVGLSRVPVWITWSERSGRLYLAYAGGDITWLDMRDAEPVEHHFTSLATTPRGMLAIEDFLFATDPSGAWNRYYSFDANGSLVSTVDWRNTSPEFHWNASLQRIYYVRAGVSPSDMEWTAFSARTGALGADGESPYHDSQYARTPMRIHPDGSYLVMGSGYIHETATLQKSNQLPNAVIDAAWVSGYLHTLQRRDDGTIALQTWSGAFSLLDTREVAANGSAWLFADNLRPVVVNASAGRVLVTSYPVTTLPDADGDGVFDLGDNCLTLSNPSQSDIDADGQGDPCDSDADADELPDDFERSAGLDPANATDAAADLDGDGASNLLEFLSGTDPAQAGSTPARVADAVQSFEDAAWAALPWRQPSGNSVPVRYQGGAKSGQYSLRFQSASPEQKGVVEMHGRFPNGSLTFHLQMPASFFGVMGTFEVFVDGVSVFVSQGSEWSTQHQVAIAPGEHRIRFVHRLFLSSDQLASLAFLDDVAFTEINDDYDADGVLNTSDNCPHTVNAAQANNDLDSEGDACDTDDDNDLLPDTVELSVGLDPLDSLDALLDLDGDGASNRLEYRVGTGMNDAGSKPPVIGDFSESFENAGWEGSRWYAVDGVGVPLRGTGTAHHGSYALLFRPAAVGDRQVIELTGVFAYGELRFQAQGSSVFSSLGTFEVFVDGISRHSATLPGYGTGVLLPLDGGEHTVRFEYRKTATGTGGVNLDSVSFTVVDDDRDDDGVLNDGDNCPDTANPSQWNTDGDAQGNVCDTDDDGDGLADTVEDSYAALDPLDPTDVDADTDGDGVANGYEIGIGHSPDLHDDYNELPMHLMLRLQNHYAVYRLNGVLVAWDWRFLGGNRWELSRYGNTETYEARADGFYLVGVREDDGAGTVTEATYEGGLLQFPANMQMYRLYEDTATLRVTVNGAAASESQVRTQLRLVDDSTVLLQGQDVDAGKVERDYLVTGGANAGYGWTETTVYARNNGIVSNVFGSDTEILQYLEFPPPPPPSLSAEDKQALSMGLTGALPWPALAFLALLAARRRPRRVRSVADVVQAS